MALTYSSMLDLQTDLINFKLHNVVDNNNFSSSELNTSKPTIIMFICNHCPYVKDIINRVVKDFEELNNIGVGTAAIMPNDTESYPEDSYENMKLFSNIVRSDTRIARNVGKSIFLPFPKP